MEDIEASSDPATPDPGPGQGDQPGDVMNPDFEEEHSVPDPPIGAPDQDMEATEDQAPDVTRDSDAESALSDIDEAQFEDFDPNAIAIEERPVYIDESNIGLIGKHKRRRMEGDESEKRKKRKEGGKEKTRRPRDDDDDNFSGGEQVEGKRERKSKPVVDGSARKDRPRQRQKSPENLDNLTPEEQRRRKLDKAMDEALRSTNRRRRRQPGFDLDALQDEYMDSMRRRMSEAAEADGKARMAVPPRPAMHKLKMLPEVVSMLRRNNLRDQLVDPEINVLEAVRFFLEPLDDGSLPAYNIQREIFTGLTHLHMTKEALIASSIGKVVVFYTKTKLAEPAIKRLAERLVGEWTRPILNRTIDYRKRFTQSGETNSIPVRPSISPAARAKELARERALALPDNSRRARVEGGELPSYTIVPKSSFGGREAAPRTDDPFKRLKLKQAAQTSAAAGRRR